MTTCDVVPVRLRTEELERRMAIAGLTGSELARRAKVAEATVSRARRGLPIHVATLRQIARALSQAEEVPGIDSLLDLNGRRRGDSRPPSG
jgi:transcriptional regulator with XRE-family HTH domain